MALTQLFKIRCLLLSFSLNIRECPSRTQFSYLREIQFRHLVCVSRGLLILTYKEKTKSAPFSLQNYTNTQYKTWKKFQDHLVHCSSNCFPWTPKHVLKDSKLSLGNSGPISMKETSLLSVLLEQILFEKQVLLQEKYTPGKLFT